jgi:hypothetical protein
MILNIWIKIVFLYKNGKLRTVETIPGMRGGRDKEE